MIYLIDTDVVIDAMSSQPASLAALSIAADTGLWMSVVSLGELYEGAAGHSDPLQRHQEIENYLAPFKFMGLTAGIMFRFGSIRSRLRQHGQLISDFDIVIGATAIEHDLRLITRNRKHFERIPALSFMTPNEILRNHGAE